MSASSKKKLRKEQNAALLTEKQQNEQKEAKKLKAYTLTFVVIMAVVLVLSVGTMAVTAYINSGITERGAEAVKIGDYTLSNADLNFYYVDAVNEQYSEWYNTYSDSTATIVQTLHNLDLSKPLDTQKYDETKSYADHFAEKAIENATETYAVYTEALKNGVTLSDEDKAEIDSAISNMQMYAGFYGYSNLKDYLKAVYGKGATEANFRNYMEVNAVAQNYEAEYHDGLTYAESDLAAYDKEHYKEFTSYHYTSFPVRSSDFLVCESADDKNHTHTEAEETAALKAAEEAAKALAATGATNAVALNAEIKKLDAYKDKATAASTANKDVLFTSITNEAIAQWLSDESRKEGDIAYLDYDLTSTDEEGNETTSQLGYYVVIFEGKNENEAKLVNVRHILAKFKGGSTGDDGKTTYSENEKKAALDTINDLKAKWESGDATEDSFASLAKEKTEDTASAEDGGLFEDVYPGQMVTNFNDWCFDETRKAGDVGVVETEYGYHLIYFVKTTDTTYRNYMIESALRDKDYDAWFEATAKAINVTTLDTSKLSRDMVLEPA